MLYTTPHSQSWYGIILEKLKQLDDNENVYFFSYEEYKGFSREDASQELSRVR